MVEAVSKVNWKWAGLLGLQVGLGVILLYFPPEGAEGMQEFGKILLGAATGQAATAQMKAAH